MHTLLLIIFGFSFAFIMAKWQNIKEFIKTEWMKIMGGTFIFFAIVYLIGSSIISGESLSGDYIIFVGLFTYGVSFFITKDSVIKKLTLLFSFSIILACGANIIFFGNLSPEYMETDMQNAWIGYLGAVLGGFITMIGVMYTIDNENKKSEEEKKKHQEELNNTLAIQYRPILKLIDAEKCYTDYQYGEYILELFMHDDYTEEDIYKITLKNVGRGEAIIDGIIHKLGDSAKDYFLFKITKDYDRLIVTGEEMTFLLFLEKTEEFQEKGFDLEFIIHYYDAFKNSDYYTKVQFLFEVNAETNQYKIYSKKSEVCLSSEYPII